MSVLNVAQVLGYLASRFGGPPECAKHYGAKMTKMGLEVSYWATGNHTDRNELSYLGKAAHIFDPSWPHGWFRSRELGPSLESEIGSIDLLHLHEIWTYPLYVSARLARKHGKPYLIAPHGIFTVAWRYNTLKKKLYRRLVANPMIKGATCFQALTAAEIHGIRESGYRGAITVVPGGVHPEEFLDLPPRQEAEQKWPVLKGKRVVHFLSRLSREKGLDQLIPAWADVVRGESYADCVLVLSGPDHQGYGFVVEGLIKSHNLDIQVLLPGMVSGRDKAALISRSDIYVLPSYSEGFSVSVLENLAARKPVLITPGCNFPEVVDAGAGLCVPPQRDLLAQGLRQLLDMSDSDREQMGRRGRDLVMNNYTWEMAARKLITVYNCILTGKEIPLFPEPIELDANGKPLLT